MKDEWILEEIDQKIRPDENHAQILIEIGPSSKTFEKAKEIIEALGIQILEGRKLSPSIILVRLDTMDMRSITLRLIEHGFSNIKGINAINFKT